MTASAFRAFLRRHRVLIAIIAAGTLVRVWQFGSVPPGLNQDEVSLGYDAWALLQYGIDRNGMSFPMHLIAWGSGMNAPAAYLMWPFLLLLGPTAAAVRGPNLAAGILLLPLWFLLVRRIAGERTALVATLLLALAPWHVMLSRWALESNLFPPAFILAVFLLVLGAERPRFLWGAGAAFGLCLYTYGPAYLVVPAFVAASFAYLLWTGKAPVLRLFDGLIAFIAVSAPVSMFLAVNHWRLDPIRTPVFTIPRLTGTPRFETTSSVFSEHVLRDAGVNLRQAWDILLHQSDGLLWNAIPGHGLFFTWMLPVCAAGLLLTLWRLPSMLRAYDGRMLMLLWFCCGLLLAAAMPANINRLNVWIPVFLYFGAVTLEHVLRRSRILFAAAGAAYVLSFASFAQDYFTGYPAQIAGPFHAGFGEAVAEAATHPGTLCITDGVNMPYVYALFHGREDPREFLRTAVYSNPGGEFQWVSSFGRYVFGTDGCKGRGDIGAYVVQAWRENEFPARDIRRFGDFVVIIPR